MRHRRAIQLVFGYLVLAHVAPAVHACSCGREETVEQAVANSSAVFEARVVQLSSPITWLTSEGPTPVGHRIFRTFEGGVRYSSPESIEVKMELLRSWKGDFDDSVVIHTGQNMCGYPFEISGTYFVYVFEGDDGPRTNVCTRTRLSTNADDEGRLLGPPIRDHVRDKREPNKSVRE